MPHCRFKHNYSQLSPRHFVTNQVMYRVFIFTVDANDAMYGNDVKFLNEIAKLSHTLVEEVLTHIKNLDNPQVSLFYVYSLK